MLKKLIKKIFFFFIPIRNIILFESAPDYSDNTRAVFDEMLHRGLNKKYKFVWLAKTPCPFKEKNVISILQSDKFKRRYYYNVAKLIICCNSIFIHRTPRP